MEPQNPDILNMPMLPLRGLVLFPRMILHFDVGRPRSVRAVEHAIRNNTPIFIPGTGEPGGLPSIGSHRVRHD